MTDVQCDDVLISFGSDVILHWNTNDVIPHSVTHSASSAEHNDGISFLTVDIIQVFIGQSG